MTTIDITKAQEHIHVARQAGVRRGILASQDAIVALRDATKDFEAKKIYNQALRALAALTVAEVEG